MAVGRSVGRSVAVGGGGRCRQNRLDGPFATGATRPDGAPYRFTHVHARRVQ